MMKKLLEFFRLIGINLLTQCRRLIEFINVLYRYYPNLDFLKLDLSLSLPYFFKSPYAIHKKFLQRQGAEDIYTYGETPLTTLDKISQKVGLTSQDAVFDLGCGPGRTSLWLHSFISCRVIGIEQIPIFVERAQSVAQRFNLKGIEFHLGDIRDFDYSDASVIYLYGTCFDEEFLAPLIEKMRRLGKDSKIITVSYSLNEFTSEPYFEVIKQFPARFTWGEAMVFVQRPR